MQQREQPRRAVWSKRDLLRLDLRHGSLDEIVHALHGLLTQTSLSHEERVEVLCSAVVVEALRPYWTGGRTPHEAHQALRLADPEIADAIESLAPMLLGRAEAKEQGREALAAVEALLRGE